MLVRSTIIYFFVLSRRLRGPVFAVLSSPYPREGISDVLARGSIIPVLTVLEYRNRKVRLSSEFSFFFCLSEELVSSISTVFFAPFLLEY